MFMTGEPEHFGHNVMGNPRGLFATINVSLLVWGGVKQKDLLHRSRRVQSLTNWLEAQNIRTSIRVFSLNQCGYAEIVVKDYQDQFNINNLAVATHTDFFRRHIFRQLEWSPTWTYGYGSSISTVKPEQIGITLTIQGDPSSKKETDKDFDTYQEKIATAIAEGVHECHI